MSSIKCPVHAVEVERGRETIVVEVPEHEVEVLRATHGPGNVRIVQKDVGEAELDASADLEFTRLQRRYRRVNAPDPVLMAFRDGVRGLERHGFSLERVVQDDAPRAGIRDHRKKKAAKPA